MTNDINKLCKVAYEMINNCDNDLVGDHREFYNPRIKNIFIIVGKLFPVQMATYLATPEIEIDIDID